MPGDTGESQTSATRRLVQVGSRSGNRGSLAARRARGPLREHSLEGAMSRGSQAGLPEWGPSDEEQQTPCESSRPK